MSLKSSSGENKKNNEKKEGKRKAAFNHGIKGEKKLKKKMRFEFKTNLSSKIPEENSKCDAKPDTKRGETGVKTEMSEKSQMLNKDESCPEFFGVRSYLHNFYESVSIRNPQLYEDIYDDEMIYLNQTRKQRKAALFCWKFNMGLGAFTLGLGVVFILVGYLTPLHEGITSHQEDFVIIDRDAARFNYYIKLCRIIGLIVFCIGGCIFCFTLLLSFFFNIQCAEDDDEEDPLEPLCVTLSTEEVPQTPTDKKIPATEELTSVQPKRDVEEVVMTNSGLCKPPTAKANPEN